MFSENRSVAMTRACSCVGERLRERLRAPRAPPAVANYRYKNIPQMVQKAGSLLIFASCAADKADRGDGGGEGKARAGFAAILSQREFLRPLLLWQRQHTALALAPVSARAHCSCSCSCASESTLLLLLLLCRRQHTALALALVPATAHCSCSCSCVSESTLLLLLLLCHQSQNHSIQKNR